MAHRTVVTMLYADSTRATFGIFRANVRNPDGDWSWSTHHARQIASVTIQAGAPRPSYRALAEQFATPDYPAQSYREDGWSWTTA